MTTPKTDISPVEVAGNLGLKGEVRAPSLEVSKSSDTDDTSTTKRGTFKVSKPDADKAYPLVNAQISLPTVDA